MKRTIQLILPMLLLLSSWTAAANDEDESEPHPIQLKGVLEWKTIWSAVLSSDGQWFGYCISPKEGNSSIVIKNISESKEYKYFGEEDKKKSYTRFTFSDDSKWAVVVISPDWQEQKKLKKDKKPVHNDALVLKLDSGTIVQIYERMSQGYHEYPYPRLQLYNTSVYTSNGYAVLMPDIEYQLNDPGMSAVWCLVPAVKAAIDTGVVDRHHIGLCGHSWGGYQTSFVITQTNLFRAAIAGAPLTNMISMYSSVYWRIGYANQPIFESGQGRFKGGYWDHLDAYQRNSPVYFARNVNPLSCCFTTTKMERWTGIKVSSIIIRCGVWKNRL